MFTTSRCLLAIVAAALLIAGGAGGAGCETNSTKFIPNPDRDLNKSLKEFSADAAARKYPATQPSPTQVQQAPFRGEVDYQLRVINIANLSDTTWNNVEVWANGQYVCFVPTFPAKMQRGIAFRILFSPDGLRPPLKGLWLQKVELLKDGVLYSVPIFAAD